MYKSLDMNFIFIKNMKCKFGKSENNSISVRWAQNPPPCDFMACLIFQASLSRSTANASFKTQGRLGAPRRAKAWLENGAKKTAKVYSVLAPKELLGRISRGLFFVFFLKWSCLDFPWLRMPEDLLLASILALLWELWAFEKTPESVMMDKLRGDSGLQDGPRQVGERKKQLKIY